MSAAHLHLDHGGRPRCGQGSQLTADKGNVTCGNCIAIITGTKNPGHGYQWADVKPCGTPAAYRRHLRRGERIDESCRRAEAREKADRKRDLRRAA